MRFLTDSRCFKASGFDQSKFQQHEYLDYVGGPATGLPRTSQRGKVAKYKPEVIVRSLRTARTAIVQCLILWWSSGLKAVLRFYARDIRAIGEVISV
jgi:hypothetical protein